MNKYLVMALFLVLSLCLVSCDDGGTTTKYVYAGCGLTDDDAVNSDAANLSGADFAFAEGDSLISVTGDFTLPSEGGCGSAITWASDDADTVSITDTAAAVTRPGTVGSGNATVKLLATVTKGLSTADREIEVDVAREKWVQDAYIKASNAGAGDFFGCAVAISGDTLVAGAQAEQSTATGVTNADGDDNDTGVATYVGAAYIFKKSGTNWVQDAYLKPSNTHDYEMFGFSAAIDGDTVVVGAALEYNNATVVNNNEGHPTVAESSLTSPESGAAYVFRKDTSGNWVQEAYLKASNSAGSDNFGLSVGISGDIIVVGAYFEDSSYTGIVNTDGADSEPGTLTDSGAVYVFKRDSVSGDWAQDAYIKPSNTGAGDYFGWSVAISGNTLVVGAIFEDSNSTVITHGSGVSGSDGGASDNYGAAYVFQRATTGADPVWSQVAYFKASNASTGDQFGYSVAVNGDTIAVGATSEASQLTTINSVGHPTVAESNDDLTRAGAVYVFRKYTDGHWYQDAFLKASNPGQGFGTGTELERGDTFGNSVSISGDIIVVGSKREDSGQDSISNDDETATTDDSAGNSGAAYVFRKNAAGYWVQDAYLKPSNTGLGDEFGWSVAVDGTTIAVSSVYEDSNAAGITNADGTATGTNDGNANDSGAAFVFTIK